MAAPALRFILLGPLEAYRGDTRIDPRDWRTRQTRAVLALLLAHRGSRITFDDLGDAVWPESDAVAARESLRTAIRTLRRVLEPDLARGADSRFIRTEGSAYMLAREAVATDVDEFERARQRGLALERAGDVAAAATAFSEAAALYRGDFVADEPQATWAISARERLREDYLAVVDRLAVTLAALGRGAEAVDPIERALRLDPAREELYAHLMRAHSAAGYPAHALAAFERCSRALRSELGSGPAAATIALRDRIRSEASHAGEARRGPTVDGSAAFVGRADELARLEAALRPTGGSSRVAVVRAGAGEGKTQFVRRFTDSSGRVPLWLTAHEAERDVAYAPLIAALSAWIERTPPARLERLRPYAAVLSQVVPAARELAGPSAVGAVEQGQVLEVLTIAALRALGTQPALLVLDDAQWADRATLTWLSYALRRLPPTAGLVVITRTGDIDDSVATVLDAARRDGAVTEIELPSLALADVARLASVQLGSSTPELAGRVHAATRGNAFYVVEALREIARTGKPDTAVPASVREAVVARLRAVPPNARRALDALAVVAVPSPAPLVAVVAQTSDTVAALDDLLARGLARPGDDARTYAIDHPIVARVVYEDLTPGLRGDLHGRAAGVLAADPDPHVAASAIRHFIAGGASAAEIVRAALAAGAASLHRYAYADALAAFTVAREQAARARSDPALWWRIEEARAEALQGVGRRDDALSCYEELLPLAPEGLSRARLLRKMAIYLSDQQPARSLELLERARAALPAGDDTAARIERGQVAAAASVTHFYRSAFADVVREGEEALALWAGDPSLAREISEQLLRIGAGQQRLGALDRAEALYMEGAARARAIGDRVLEARILDSLALVLQNRGDLSGALSMRPAVEAAFEEAAIPRLLGIAVLNRGWLLTDIGDLRGARAAYERALELLTPLPSRYWPMHIIVGLGGVLVRLGRHDEARATLERGIAMADEVSSKQRRAHARVYLGELALDAGRPEAARDEARAAIEEGESLGDSHTRREGAAILARALAAVGDDAAARAAALRGIEVARAGGFVLSEARGRLALALATKDLEELAGAEQTFRKSGARYDLAVALVARAALDPRAAKAARAEAALLSRACGAEAIERLVARRT